MINLKTEIAMRIKTHFSSLRLDYVDETGIITIRLLLLLTPTLVLFTALFATAICEIGTTESLHNSSKDSVRGSVVHFFPRLRQHV